MNESSNLARQPDPDSPAAAVQPERGDCVADVPAEVLEEVAAYHWHSEPDGEPVPDELELV
jgi:hypothetical protein